MVETMTPLHGTDYRPRDAEHAVLYRVIEEHLEAFLEAARRPADSSPLPAFVEQEFRDPITLTVNVASNAPSSVVNPVTVAGGGQLNTPNDGRTDPTTILPAGTVVPIPVMSSYGWALMVALLLVTAMATLQRRRGPRAGASR